MSFPTSKRLFLLGSNLFFLLMFSPCSNGQSSITDSLKIILNSQKEDTGKVTILNTLSRQYRQENDNNNALHYALKAGDLSKKINYKRGLGLSYHNTGLAYYNSAKYEETLNYLNQSLTIWKDLGEGERIASALNNIGIIYSELGDYPKTLDYYLQSVKLYEKINNKLEIAALYNNIGVLYFDLKDYKKALEFYLKGLEIEKIIEDKTGIAYSFSNIGGVYGAQEDYQNALVFFLQSLDILKETDDSKALGELLNNIGAVYADLADYSQALNYCTQALEIRKKIDDKNGLAITLGNIGNIYLKKNELLPALQYTFQSVAIAQELRDMDTEKDFQQNLHKIYKATGNDTKALEHYERYILLKDSLYKEEHLKQILQKQMNYDFEKKEAAARADQEKKDLQVQIELQRKDMLIYGFSGISLLLLLTVGFAVLTFRQKKLRNQQEKLVLEQKLLRSQMNPHFIFNALGIIQSVIQKNKMEEALHYLGKFSKLLRDILSNSRREYIPLAEEIATLQRYLDMQKLLQDKEFEYSIQVDKDIDTELLLLPPMLAQPFIENSLKHGIAGKEKGKIEILFSLSNNLLLFSVIDNGIGVKKSQELKNGTSGHQSLAITITKERLINLNRNKRKEVNIHIQEMKNNKQETTGAVVSFEIPYKLAV